MVIFLITSRKMECAIFPLLDSSEKKIFFMKCTAKVRIFSQQKCGESDIIQPTIFFPFVILFLVFRYDEDV